MVGKQISIWLSTTTSELDENGNPVSKERIRYITNESYYQIREGKVVLEKYEGKHWQQVIPNAEFPAPLRLESNIPYVRAALMSVQLTYKDKSPVPVQTLESADPFFAYQDIVHPDTDQVASHMVVDQTIRRHGRDYRFETAPHPVHPLQERTQDNTRVGRDPKIPGYNDIAQ